MPEDNKEKKENSFVNNFAKNVEKYVKGNYTDEDDRHKAEVDVFSDIEKINVNQINSHDDAQKLLNSFNELVKKYYWIRKEREKGGGRKSNAGFFKAIDGLYSKEETCGFDVQFSRLLDEKYYDDAVSIFSGSKYINKVVPTMRELWKKCADIIIAHDRNKKIEKDKNVAVNQEVAGSEINNDQKDQPQNGAQASTTPAKSEKQIPPPAPPAPPEPGKFKPGPKVWTKDDLKNPEDLARWRRIVIRDDVSCKGKKAEEISIDYVVNFINNREKIKEQQLKEKREKAKERMKQLKEYKNKEITDKMIDEFLAKEASQKSDMVKQLGDMAERRKKAKEEAKKYEQPMKDLISKYKFTNYVEEKDSNSWLVSELTKSDQKITEDSMLKWLNFKKVFKVSKEKVPSGKLKDLTDKVIKDWVNEELKDVKLKAIGIKTINDWLISKKMITDVLSLKIMQRGKNLNMHNEEDNIGYFDIK